MNLTQDNIKAKLGLTPTQIVVDLEKGRRDLPRFVLFISFIVVVLSTNSSCKDSNRDSVKSVLQNKRWVSTDSIQLVATKLPIFLNFSPEELTLECPGLEGSVFELASMVHQHGTQLSGKQPSFTWSYQIKNEGRTISLDNGFLGGDIELRFKNNRIYWPHWRTRDSTEFIAISGAGPSGN